MNEKQPDKSKQPPKPAIDRHERKSWLAKGALAIVAVVGAVLIGKRSKA
jgi:hypothetical protein